MWKVYSFTKSRRNAMEMIRVRNLTLYIMLLQTVEASPHFSTYSLISQWTNTMQWIKLDLQLIPLSPDLLRWLVALVIIVSAQVQRLGTWTRAWQLSRLKPVWFLPRQSCLGLTIKWVGIATVVSIDLNGFIKDNLYLKLFYVTF